ncbi:MAG: DUF1638 domain-containing protein [Candidatus Limnocylindrales bacterium]
MRARMLVVACGALARELQAVVAANGLPGIDVTYLSADLHSTPRDIPAAVEERLIAARGTYDQVFVGYADCGTGGALDVVLARHGAERLPGAHCYEFFAGSQLFAQLHDAEPTTFYLTDFLLRQFDRLVWRGLGLDRWPQLRDDYFGNYTRLLYLSQFPPSDDQLAAAQRAADQLGLRLEHRHVGMGDVTPTLLTIAGRQRAVPVVADQTAELPT